MINAEFGKTITKLGFIGYFILIFLRYILLINTGITGFLSLLESLCLLAVAGVFGIMWLSERDMMDFLTAAAVGVSAVFLLCLFSGFFCIAYLFYSNEFLVCVRVLLSNAFYLVLAARIFRENKIIALLLLCAFAYELFGEVVFNLLFYRGGHYQFWPFLQRVGYVVCAGIPCLERLAED